MAPEVLTAMDVVLRLEKKMDDGFAEIKQELGGVLKDHEERIRVVEKSGIVLRGVWVTLGVITSVVAGSAGLIIGVLAYTGTGA